MIVPKKLHNFNQIVLPFLGARDYLHGTTLFRCVRPLAPANAQTCFRIMRVIRSNTVGFADSNSIKNPVARLDWCVSGKHSSLAIEQLPCSDPLQREAYDEDSVTKLASVNEKVAIRQAPSPFDAVATAVPLLKKILRFRTINNHSGQWMFTRLDTRNQEPSVQTPFTVRLESLKPEVIAKASIHVGLSIWGEIYFSWVKHVQ